jgi:hypothetical protein
VNFTDVDQSTADEGVPYDRTMTVADTPQFDMATFLARPIKLNYWVIPATNTTFATSVSPWNDFLINTRVVNRINNYAFIRAKLHIKFVVNGTPFHFGRILVSYEPLPNTSTIGGVNPFPSFTRGDTMRASQRQHLYLNPTTNQGGEMVLPFLWPENAIPLTSTPPNIGSLMLHSIVNIVCLSANPSPITVSMYAWMEDVELIAPTSRNAYGLVPQGDEYGKTPLSDTATNLSDAIGAFDKVPVIGPYARATSMAVGAGATIARALGYSKPCILDQPKVMKQVPLGNMTNYNSEDPSVRMTMDAKQELTIDPRTVGLKRVDEMDIGYLCNKESIYSYFTWSINDPPNAMIWSSALTPKMFYVDPPALGVSAISTTPSGWICTNFKFWRGSLKFRFQVVRSMYHTGRLRVVFDPTLIPSNLWTNHQDNLVHSWIVDLSETEDMVVECGWVQRTNYLPIHRDRIDLFNILDDPVLNGPSVTSSGTANGAISVHIVTPLVIPNSALTDTDVRVIVSVSSSDMEFAVPSEDGLKLLTYMPKLTPQGLELISQGEVMQSEDVVEPEAGPAHVSLYTPAPIDPTTQVFFGERIVSLRQLLKRYCNHCSYTPDPTLGAAAMNSFRVLQPAFPFAQGYYAGAPFVDNSAARVSYSQQTLLNYYTPAYVGWRGSIRWKVVRDGFRGTVAFPSQMTIHSVDTNTFDVNTTTIPSFATASAYAYWNYLNAPTGASALVLAQSTVNPTLEVEIPFYSNLRMASARALDLGSTSPALLCPDIRVAVRGLS